MHHKIFTHVEFDGTYQGFQLMIDTIHPHPVNPRETCVSYHNGIVRLGELTYKKGDCYLVEIKKGSANEANTI